MKNKIELKKCLYRAILCALLFIMLGYLLYQYEYQKMVSSYNYKLNGILQEVQNQYPEISKSDLMDILNSPSSTDQSFAMLFGIDMEKESLIQENEEDYLADLLLHMGLVLGAVGSVSVIFLFYNRKKDKELEQITHYIEEINQKNYRLEIEAMSEDELSMLKSEIYKTTVMLKEIAENSVKDKENLKNSLSDISHQMKTPLTSISVILDNLIDDSEMDENIRAEFFRDMKREISNINFLVQALLKMAKLDSGTVNFIKDEVPLNKIAEAAMKNVSMLCDLKNIKVETEFLEPVMMVCDYRWQVEALTNILKNSVEHSPANSSVIIKIGKNTVYGWISIQDFGVGIDEEDQKHLFERFYRGKNAGSDSVGIGLALAKTIVENDNGHIFVESSEKGTKFTVKYSF